MPTRLLLGHRRPYNVMIRTAHPLRGAECSPVEAIGMGAECSDRALVARWKQGDREAFALIHRRYYARIFHYAYLRIRSVEEAEDVASETFCRALHKIHSYEFRHSESLYPWLHQIAAHLIIDRLRRCPDGRVHSLDARVSEALSAFLEQLSDPTPSPEELAQQREVRDYLLAAIDRLPEDQARAIVYRYLAEFSIREIARELDRSEGAVKSLLHRALLSLRAQLKSEIDRHHSIARARVEPSRDHVQQTVQAQRETSR